MPKLSEATRADRRQRLIESGWQCLAKSSYADLSVDEICLQASISKGAFYGYFPHKEALLLALLEDDAHAMEDHMAKLAAAEPSALMRLRSFAASMLEHAQAPGRAQIAADLWAAMLSDARVRRVLGASTARRRRILRSWIEAGVASGELVGAPANALASLMLALGDGLTIHARLDPEAFKWENIRVTVDLLLRALEPR